MSSFLLVIAEDVISKKPSGKKKKPGPTVQ